MKNLNKLIEISAEYETVKRKYNNRMIPIWKLILADFENAKDVEEFLFLKKQLMKDEEFVRANKITIIQIINMTCDKFNCRQHRESIITLDNGND